MCAKQQGHANQNTTTRTSDKGAKKIEVTLKKRHPHWQISESASLDLRQNNLAGGQVIALQQSSMGMQPPQRLPNYTLTSRTNRQTSSMNTGFVRFATATTCSCVSGSSSSPIAMSVMQEMPSTFRPA